MKVYVVIFFVMAMFVLYEYKEKIKSKGKKIIVFFLAVLPVTLCIFAAPMKIPNQVKAE